MDRYDQNSFYYSITEELWCWKQTSSGKIYKAKSKSELLKIKEKQFVGSGNYEREYNLGEDLISTEEFGKIADVGTKQYISLLLKRGTTPVNNYDKNQGGDGVHKPEARRKKGLHPRLLQHKRSTRTPCTYASKSGSNSRIPSRQTMGTY